MSPVGTACPAWATANVTVMDRSADRSAVASMALPSTAASPRTVNVWDPPGAARDHGHVAALARRGGMLRFEVLADGALHERALRSWKRELVATFTGGRRREPWIATNGVASGARIPAAYSHDVRPLHVARDTGYAHAPRGFARDMRRVTFGSMTPATEAQLLDGVGCLKRIIIP